MIHLVMSMTYCPVSVTMRLCRRSLTGLAMVHTKHAGSSSAANGCLAVALPLFLLSRDMLRRRRRHNDIVWDGRLRMHVESCCVVSSCMYPYKQSRPAFCCLLSSLSAPYSNTHTSLCYQIRLLYIRTLHHIQRKHNYQRQQTTHSPTKPLFNQTALQTTK